MKWITLDLKDKDVFIATDLVFNLVFIKYTQAKHSENPSFNRTYLTRM